MVKCSVVVFFRLSSRAIQTVSVSVSPVLRYMLVARRWKRKHSPLDILVVFSWVDNLLGKRNIWASFFWQNAHMNIIICHKKPREKVEIKKVLHEIWVLRSFAALANVIFFFKVLLPGDPYFFCSNANAAGTFGYGQRGNPTTYPFFV